MQSRLDFLAGSALAALAPSTGGPSPSASPSTTPSPKPSPDVTMPPLNFDVPAFDAALNVGAAHKHMFAATRLEGGLVLGQMRGVLDAYKEIGVSATDVHPVAVLYHGAAALLAFNDAMWNQYFIPLVAKLKSDNEIAKDVGTVYQAGKTKGNPCLKKTPSKDDSSIEGLVADAAARFFVCNQLTKGFASFIARDLKLEALEVYKNLAANLVPNAMLVPAGIWAVAAVPERRYTYQQSTLQA